MADPSVSLCDEADVDGYVHIGDEVLRSPIVCMDEGKRDHYMFLHAALAKCERCLAFCLHHGADLSRGTASHPDWIALEWGHASNASPGILRLLTASVWPSLRPGASCAGPMDGESVLPASPTCLEVQRDYNLVINLLVTQI